MIEVLGLGQIYGACLKSMAKFLALRDGALDFGIQHFEVEIEAEAVITIRNSDIKTKKLLLPFVNDCRSISTSLTSFQMDQA